MQWTYNKFIFKNLKWWQKDDGGNFGSDIYALDSCSLACDACGLQHKAPTPRPAALNHVENHKTEELVLEMIKCLMDANMKLEKLDFNTDSD